MLLLEITEENVCRSVLERVKKALSSTKDKYQMHLIWGDVPSEYI